MRHDRHDGETDADAPPPWVTHERTELARTPIFTIHRTVRSSARDPRKRGGFVTIESNDWANIIAITPDRKVVFIEQYRHGLDEVTLEIPGGILEPGEDPATAALRELKEETGYSAPGARLLGSVSANPAILNNRMHHVCAEGVTLTGPAEPDGNEEIAVRLIPLDAVDGLIRSGRIHHALVVSAFHMLKLAT